MYTSIHNMSTTIHYSDDGGEEDDPPDIVSFADSSCSEDIVDFSSSHGDMVDYPSSHEDVVSEEVQVFELEMSSDLDIEQIEKD